MTIAQVDSIFNTKGDEGTQIKDTLLKSYVGKFYITDTGDTNYPNATIQFVKGKVNKKSQVELDKQFTNNLTYK